MRKKIGKGEKYLVIKIELPFVKYCNINDKYPIVEKKKIKI